MPEATTSSQPEAIRLEDYEIPDFLIDTVELHFDLRDGITTVENTMRMRRNPAAPSSDAPLVLDGHDLEFVSASLDSIPLPPDRFQIDTDHLRIHVVPDVFTLTTVVKIRPEKNTALEGLYRPDEFYCTQCEAEGFRRITYYLDRPDVLAKFTTTIEADKTRFPVLLSNGNPVKAGDTDDGRHFVIFEDPYSKPCYLFALVAGDLAHIEDRYRTVEGRNVKLRIYTTEANIDRCDHAMRSLKKAMKWDEDVFGLACDLDNYSIVVTDDFNMGAMENKGLNVFNSKYVLARPDTATDSDFAGIEGVIGHEYFHNWTGNRVTCRDWFQLSLKEGLTVFRDQQFSGDMNSPAIQRIRDVRTLRNHQFAEDAGPMAHPVRPSSVIEINNFYTVTVYEKGAEVVRMYHTLFGAEGFRRGMDRYIEQFDGQAVTCDDFRQAMADANGRNLDRFANWYSQAGTPVLDVSAAHDPKAQTYSLTMEQSCPPTPGLDNDKPFHIPVAVGLLDSSGRDMPLRRHPGDEPQTTAILELTEKKQTFTFINVPVPPVPSLLRGFSAPVSLRFEHDDQQLAFLAAHDSDSFCRWDAIQHLAVKCMQQLIADHQSGTPSTVPDELTAAFRNSLERRDEDRALTAELLGLPAESFLGDTMDIIDVEAVHEVRKSVKKELATALRPQLLATYEECESNGPYTVEPAAVARRNLRYVCLAYLTTLDEPGIEELCLAQLHKADNMTEGLAALVLLCHSGAASAQQALTEFHDKWRDDPLVLDKWFSIQATSPQPGTLDRVVELMSHPAFSITNPNKVRALIGAFCGQNRINFHQPDGAGYTLLADQVIKLNELNPQIAARLTSVLNHWKRFASPRRELMEAELRRILSVPTLRRDVYEIATRALA